MRLIPHGLDSLFEYPIVGWVGDPTSVTARNQAGGLVNPPYDFNHSTKRYPTN
jgi:hypothetical protein